MSCDDSGRLFQRLYATFSKLSCFWRLLEALATLPKSFKGTVIISIPSDKMSAVLVKKIGVITLNITIPRKHRSHFKLEQTKELFGQSVSVCHCLTSY